MLNLQISDSVRLSKFWKHGGPEGLASTLAFAGLLISTFLDFNPYTRQNAGSDFKTLYASSWCFVRHVDAYRFQDIAAVFRLNHVVEPLSWYGHAPVYPPFTLALLAPLTALPMVTALRLWTILSAVLMGLAASVLASYSKRAFGLTLKFRLLIIALIACSPLVSAGLELGNVSILVAALCSLVITASPTASGWLAGIGLMIALLLKPHMAIWIAISLLFSRRSLDRKIILRTCIVGVVSLILMSLWALSQSEFSPRVAGFRRMVSSELANGSMAAGNRDLMEVPVQITSLSHLLAYWITQATALRVLNIALLLLLAIAVVWASSRFSQTINEKRFMIALLWCSFGLVATYHRAADGTLLLFSVPVLVGRLYHSLRDGYAWGILCLLIAGSLGPSLATLRWLSGRSGMNDHLSFLFLRQAALANLCLLLVLLADMIFARRFCNRHASVHGHSE